MKGKNNLLQQNFLFCFCGPVASGKSTICSRIVASDKSVRLSVSSTTRSPRCNDISGMEVEGKDYFFLSRNEFEKRVSEGKFIEHAEFSDNLYGTELSTVEKAFDGSYDLLLDIEVQGVSQLKKIYPDNVVTVFVIPPAINVLVERLGKRKSDSAEEIERRIEIARKEIDILTSSGFSDYIIVNNELNSAVTDALSIIRTTRLKVGKSGLSSFKQAFWNA